MSSSQSPRKFNIKLQRNIRNEGFGENEYLAMHHVSDIFNL